MAFNPANIANAFIEGRQARQQYDYGQSRNKLAEFDVQNAPTEIANRNALAQQATTRGAQVNETGQMQLDQGKAQQAHAILSQALDSGNPKAFVLQNVPVLAQQLKDKQGIDLASLPDDEANAMLGDYARVLAGHAGMTPTPAPVQWQDEKGPGGSLLQRNPLTGEIKQVVPREPTQPRQNDERLVQIADENGNPKWVRESDAVNQPAYVARDKPAAADLKLRNDAKMKMPRVSATLRQLDRVEKASQAIANNKLFDGGEVDAKVIDRTQEGRELVAAIAQLRPSLTALTRVPGIGSQSDLEARLDGLQFPSSDLPPAVRQKNVEELKAFVSDLRDVYTSLAGDQSPEQEQAPQAAPAQPQQGAPRQQAPQSAIDYLKANPQFKGAFQQKYGYLP
jgi:hypothetical protein